MKKRLSIVDIAQRVGVSTTTVSFILNGKAKEKRISDSLTKKVLDLIEEVEYKPNHLAQSLRTGKTNIICLIVEDISNPFFANVARLIEENAYQKGYKIVYCSTDNDVEKTRELIRVFSQRQVDGYIITAPQGIESDLKALIDNKIPLILFDRYLSDIDSDYVIIDNYQSTYQAIQHLITNGYKRIAFLSVNSDQNQMLERQAGYDAAIKNAGLENTVFKIEYRQEAPVEDLKKILRENPEIDALFFATNYLAIHGLEAINALGLRIPEDLGIVAFDDHDIFRIYKPGITTIAQPIEEISYNLINSLLAQLDNSSTRTETSKTVLPAHLIVRGSSKSKH
ncbi:MAG: LacI family DNA-binding transcriptional regulator [Mucilaginibacter polytrichastri]|nr:LacI family DNA-binding transcriptional regulator [Mucilaginibacter polytrichastri]